MVDLFIVGIILFGLGYALFSVFVQRRLSNIDRMYELRAHMNTKTKELISMSKSKAPQEHLMAKQKELSSISMESMKNQMKPMIVILPVLGVIEYLVLPNLFSASGISINLLGFVLGYQLCFFVVVFIVGIALSITLSMHDRRRLGHKYNFGLLQPSLKEQGSDQQPPATPQNHS